MVLPTVVLPRRDTSSGSVASCLETISVAILCVAIVAGPLALGGTPAWACFGLEAAMATAAILWAVARPRPVTALVIPLIVGGLVLLQLVPLPDRLLTLIAPVSARSWQEVHDGMPGAWGRISITPAASATAARRLLLGSVTVIVVADLAMDPLRRRRIVAALAAMGAIVWLLAAVIPVDSENRTVYGIVSLRGPIDYWKTPDLEPIQTSGVGYLDWVHVGDQRYLSDEAITGTGLGPFVYANHFANALCLAVPALCAIWLANARAFLPGVPPLVGTIFIVAAGLWGSHIWAASRAGTASLLLGTAVYLSLIVERRWLRWLLGGAAAMGVVTLVVFMGVLQGPLGGLTTFVSPTWQPLVEAVMQDARIAAARIAGRMFLASPILGTGLGSYGDLFPRFHGRGRIMYFAHNDHAQLWAEAGLVGIAVSVLAAGVLLRRLVQFSAERCLVGRSMDAAAWAALAAGVAHSVFDWNMHVPANAFLACVIVGLALSSGPRRAARSPGHDRSSPSWLTTSVFVGVVLSATALLARDASLARPLADLRRAITVARLASSRAEHAEAVDRLAAAITAGEAAFARAAGDWRLPVLLGQAHLHLDAMAMKHAHVLTEEPSRDGHAAGWFRQARLASPACRGLPETEPCSSP